MKDALKVIREIRRGRFSISRHARMRMAERRITREDIIEVARTCYEQSWQEERASYRLMGHLLDGNAGGIVVAYRNGAVIVTVLDRRRGR